MGAEERPSPCMQGPPAWAAAWGQTGPRGAHFLSVSLKSGGEVGNQTEKVQRHVFLSVHSEEGVAMCGACPHPSQGQGRGRGRDRGRGRGRGRDWGRAGGRARGRDRGRARSRASSSSPHRPPGSPGSPTLRRRSPSPGHRVRSLRGSRCTEVRPAPRLHYRTCSLLPKTTVGKVQEASQMQGRSSRACVPASSAELLVAQPPANVAGGRMASEAPADRKAAPGYCGVRARTRRTCKMRGPPTVPPPPRQPLTRSSSHEAEASVLRSRT